MRLKTRGLIYQNPDGSYPATDAVPFVADNLGTIGFSPVGVDVSGNMTVPGNLVVDGGTTVSGNLVVDGGTTVSGNLVVDGGNLVVDGGNLVVDGGNLVVDGGNLVVDGDAHLTSVMLSGVCPSVSSTTTVTLQPEGGNVGIGTCEPSATLDISGYLNIVTQASDVFYSSPGVHTYTIPSNINQIRFEVFGAGGFCNKPLNVESGTGAYMSGTINVTGFHGKTLQIQVGASAPGFEMPATASYIAIAGEQLFVIAGAGGGAERGADGSDPVVGGSAGGGPFTGGISPGGNAGPAIGPNYGSGSGGTAVGGGAGTTPGNGRPSPETYLDAAGGGGSYGRGGGGYTGGGAGSGTEGGGGGGGSSYFDMDFTNLVNSYSGVSIPPGLLPDFGRANQNGYVAIYIDSAPPSITTSGNIVCGDGFILSGWRLTMNDAGQLVATKGATTKTFTGV